MRIATNRPRQRTPKGERPQAEAGNVKWISLSMKGQDTAAATDPGNETRLCEDDPDRTTARISR